MEINVKENPLAMHFRNPAIYVKLPSNGNFWKENAVEIPINKELPVLPMTARDEISIRTPDALMNGSGVVDVIRSCVPNISDPWSIPSVDLDSILIAIRIATYGNGMDVDSKCPSCKEENTHEADLGYVIANIQMPNYDVPLDIDGLKIYLRPRTYQELTSGDVASFEERQLMRSLEIDQELSDEERIEKFNQRLQRLVELNYDILTQSIEKIVTPSNDVVNEKEFIREFLANTSNKNIHMVRDRLGELNSQNAIKPVHVCCEHCQTQYDVELKFDYSSFFG